MERMNVKGFRSVKIKTLTNALGNSIIEVKNVSIRGMPNCITQITNKRGGIDRNYYDSYGRQIKQISNHNHGNKKRHPFGEHGEHAHDYIYDEKGCLVDRPIRSLTDDERKENEDIL